MVATAAVAVLAQLVGVAEPDVPSVSVLRAVFPIPSKINAAVLDESSIPASPPSAFFCE